MSSQPRKSNSTNPRPGESAGRSFTGPPRKDSGSQQPKPRPRPAPAPAATAGRPISGGAKQQINQTLAVAMITSPANPLPFPLPIPLGIPILLSQGQGQGQGQSSA